MRKAHKEEHISIETDSKNFFDLPVEIRVYIYNLACKWVYKRRWPRFSARWNTGIGLLRTCKRVAAEAMPSVYRTFRLHSGSAIEALDKLGSKIEWVRTLEIHVSCLCSATEWGPVDMIDTVYERHCYRRGASNAGLQQYTDMWTRFMGRIQTQHGIRQLVVTFSTCCRRSRREEMCLSLENHFLDLLQAYQRADRISLAGDVPPSLAFRLQDASPDFGRSIKWISHEMDRFIKEVETSRRQWECSAQGERAVPWAKNDQFYLVTADHNRHPITHFILSRQNQAMASWNQYMEGYEVERKPAGMRQVSQPISRRSWGELQTLLDYDNMTWIRSRGLE
jgi:hypothetical protein